MKAVEVKGLTKVFGGFRAVDAVSFEVERGEVFGFLGANGAGKSTTIRMLCGILPPDEGFARILGRDVKEDPAGVKASIGYMSQRFSLYGDLTVEENINFAAGIRGLGRAELARRKREILSETDLIGQKSLRTEALPGGVKQRLALSCSLIHRPDLVFLDEPTAGVDPASRRVFWDLIQAMKEEGRTVFVTSHYMDEVEQCDRVALMNRGRIDALDSPAQLRASVLPGPVLDVQGTNSPVIQRHLQTLVQSGHLVRVDPFGRGFHAILPRRQDGQVEALRRSLIGAGAGAAGDLEVREVRPGLEDVFVYVISSRPDEASL